MESKSGVQLLEKNSPKSFLAQLKQKDLESLYNETIWPIVSLIAFVRPLHHWMTGQVAKIERGQKVLEVGSGYPLYKLYADKVGENGLFAAIDINPRIQSRAKKICYWLDHVVDKDGSNNKSVTHFVADAERLPFQDNYFDTVIASNCINSRMLEEAFRILKPGGRAIVSWDEMLSVPLITTALKTASEDVGFEQVKVKPGAPGYIVPGLAWNWYIDAVKPL